MKELTAGVLYKQAAAEAYPEICVRGALPFPLLPFSSCPFPSPLSSLPLSSRPLRNKAP